MTNETNDTIKRKIEFFVKEKIPAHINLKNGKFFNGVFKDKIKDEMYYFEDEKLGLCILVFDEVYDINIRAKKEEKYG